MVKYFIAVTYEVCEHNHICLDMNEYSVDPLKGLDEQIREFARIDIAPLVKVYESNTDGFNECSLYKEYTFKEYECGCNDHQ